MADLEDALVKQRSKRITASEMAEVRKNRIESHIQSRLTQLEELPTNRGEDLQSKCLLELYGLKRLTKIEEEEKNRVETKKRIFFAEILNAIRELQLQVQASQKRRKQRNDGVQVSGGVDLYLDADIDGIREEWSTYAATFIFK